MALGLEGRDITTVGGQTTGTLANPTTGGSRSSVASESAYGELVVPIVGAGNAMPGIRTLSLSLAARRTTTATSAAPATPRSA